jgi:hypothetical protein
MKKSFSIFSKIGLAFLFILVSGRIFSQALLNADAIPNNTYELINSILAPGATAEETPDAFHTAFGRHIAEVFDTDLNQYVFEFYIHSSVPNELQDEATGDTDRQRVEIKTYAPSPANLKGVSGDNVTYKWRFRLPVGFQPSPNFTHIHQVKAVDGDDGNPIFTLTPRYKSSGNQLELIYMDGRSASNNINNKLASVDLSLFTGNWVEATEKIKVDSLAGTYSIVITNVKTGATILSYNGNNLCTIRATNSFIRPKWGIYRSIAAISYLRDEAVRFNGFSVGKNLSTTGVKSLESTKPFKVNTSSGGKKMLFEYSLPKSGNVEIDAISINGQKLKTIYAENNQDGGFYQSSADIADLKSGIYIIHLRSGNYSQNCKLIIQK